MTAGSSGCCFVISAANGSTANVSTEELAAFLSAAVQGKVIHAPSAATHTRSSNDELHAAVASCSGTKVIVGLDTYAQLEAFKDTAPSRWDCLFLLQPPQDGGGGDDTSRTHPTHPEWLLTPREGQWRGLDCGCETAALQQHLLHEAIVIEEVKAAVKAVVLERDALRAEVIALKKELAEEREQNELPAAPLPPPPPLELKDEDDCCLSVVVVPTITPPLPSPAGSVTGNTLSTAARASTEAALDGSVKALMSKIGLPLLSPLLEWKNFKTVRDLRGITTEKLAACGISALGDRLAVVNAICDIESKLGGEMEADEARALHAAVENALKVAADAAGGDGGSSDDASAQLMEPAPSCSSPLRPSSKPHSRSLREFWRRHFGSESTFPNIRWSRMRDAFVSEYSRLYVSNSIPDVKLSLLKMLLDKDGDGFVSFEEAESFTILSGGLYNSFVALVGKPDVPPADLELLQTASPSSTGATAGPVFGKRPGTTGSAANPGTKPPLADGDVGLSVSSKELLRITGCVKQSSCNGNYFGIGSTLNGQHVFHHTVGNRALCLDTDGTWLVTTKQGAASGMPTGFICVKAPSASVKASVSLAQQLNNGNWFEYDHGAFTPNGGISILSATGSSSPSPSLAAGASSAPSTPAKRKGVASKRSASSSRIVVPPSVGLPSPRGEAKTSRTKCHSRVLRVAIFNQSKAGGLFKAVPNIKAALEGICWNHCRGKGHKELKGCPICYATTEVLNGAAVQGGRLDRSKFDLILFPGGSWALQSLALGDSGRDAIKAFVAAGGGYVGVCAGAYLACDWAPTSWGRYKEAPSLSLLGCAPVLHDASDIEPWTRGEGNCLVRLHKPLGREALWDEGLDWRAEFEEEAEDVVRVRYHNGPLISLHTADTDASLRAKDGNVPENAEAGVKVLATFDTEVRNCVGSAAIAEGHMKGTAAVVSGMYGNGKVVLLSPHFESSHGGRALAKTPGLMRLRRVLQRAVQLVTDGQHDSEDKKKNEADSKNES